ncbi:Creatinase/aminopeptidase [Neoconidiobolus thromboides FSU 785]|nr:Creatinase/aminopeptidase [Neoconidiobolus thromboides FSU 785]
MSPIDTSSQVNQLRQLMKKQEYNIHAYIVPSGDAHQSEYTADVDARRSYISGFDGSAGIAIIGLEKAYLFTDGRYYLQANEQLDSNWELKKQGESSTPLWYDFISSILPENGRVGVDSKLISISEAELVKSNLNAQNKGLKLVSIEENLIDQVWNNQPKRTKNEIEILELKYSGISFEDKLKLVRSKLLQHQYSGLVISALDEIAWLFNLRGSDIIYNPVFFAYATITHDEVTLYIHKEQINDKIKQYLGDKVIIKEYEEILKHLTTLSTTIKQEKILLPKNASLALLESLGKDNVSLGVSPIVLAKAIKNDIELDGFRNCHVRDAVALVKYFAYLEDLLTKSDYSKNPITEAEAADKLLEFRKVNQDFVSDSFATISSTGPNGAIIHYHPTHQKCDQIQLNQMYLCDSGAQYKDGTTDVTRTWHFGSPTEFEKEAFTRVLQGVITLETQTFPKGTTGFHLDSITRAPLWRSGLDFRHGVGHGVGSYLNVHEGPQGIGFRRNYLDIPLQPNMTVTNEPGYYEDGKFGIRTENILIVKEVKGLKNFGNLEYYGFENVTLVPIHTKLINKDLLSKFEVDYLNSYHQRVYNTLSPLLKDDDFTLSWLKKQTAAI